MELQWPERVWLVRYSPFSLLEKVEYLVPAEWEVGAGTQGCRLSDVWGTEP